MHRIAFVLLIAIGLPAAAANPQVRIHTSSGETLTRELPGHAPDRVIVEFREQPLLARAAKGGVRANAAAGLDALHDQFASDLERIHHALRGKVATASADAPRVEHRYRLAFAGASARADREALPAIRALAYVRAVYPDRRVRATLERSVPHIGAPQVWEQFHARGAGIRVAVVDSGIDYTHPALGGAFGPGHKVAGGYDFVNEDADPADDHGHGTHVAGIVAGSAAPVVGVAPEATLLAYKVLDEYGYGLDSWILAAIERLVDPDGNGNPSDRVDVANLSFGRFAANADPVVAAVEQAVAAGVVFCIAAGNEGSPFTVGSPGIAPSAVTVGASTLEDDPTSFSSSGPALHSWSVKPEVTAPGLDIVSAAIGGGTRAASGTSMAAPHTAGLAALIRQLHPAWTPAEVKAAIVGTAHAQWSVISAGAGRIDAL
ncbi:MAG TPA: S8 family serine peptidase, partial [Thermoanaerobaculia bacterium]|nr:S8 family serine peptidase [Thermoanaerobaculia bacterium]